MPLKDRALARARQKIYSSNHYQRNRERLKAEAVVGKRNGRRRAKEFVTEYKANHGCTDCGYSNPLALDFHHLRDKEANIGDAVVRGWALRRLMEEIAKCIVLCANCHRIRTHEEREQRNGKGRS